MSRAAPSSASGSGSCCSAAGEIAPWAEAALFAAARAELVERGDRAGARARRRRRLRPLRRLVARVPGHRARPRARARARAEPARGPRPAAGPDVLARSSTPTESARAWAGSATGSSARTTTSAPRVDAAYRELARASRSGSRPIDGTRPPQRDRRRTILGRASTAFLSRRRRSGCSRRRSPTGLRTRTSSTARAGWASAGPRSRSPPSCSGTTRGSGGARIPTCTCSSRSATRSASTRARAAARPAHAPVRGRPPRLPRLRRAR